MTWDPHARQNFESRKCRWEIVPWTRGRGLDLGCGIYKAFNHFIGVDNCHHGEQFGHVIKPDVRSDASDLSLFASNSLDFCFSSHLLEHFPPERVPEILTEWLRVIRPGGHLVLYLPDKALYPNIGEPGANADHRWDPDYDSVVKYLRETGCGWDLKDYQLRDQDDEYSGLYVLEKRAGDEQTFSHRDYVRPEKTACVVRFGAFGDMLQASSVIAGLHRQGFRVTLMSSPPGSDVMTHDPNVDAFLLQDRDQVPNAELGDYWAYWAKKFDRFVNLSESVEGTFLAMPGRTAHFWPPAVRHKHLNFNYLQHQHEIAGVPDKMCVRFYATAEEKAWAREQRAKMGQVVVLWQLAGSSRMHKTYPWLDEIVARLMISYRGGEYPQVDVVLTGGPECVDLENGWQEEPRVHLTCGKWSIRQTLAFLDESDVIVGGETGVLNAAACLPQPKVVFLSHSTRNNLTRDWINTVSLSAPRVTCPGRGENEAPACHMLHYDWNHCRKGEKKGVAVCMEEIHPALAFEAIQQAILNGKAKKPKLVVVA